MIRAFVIGWRDGIAEPWEINVGMSYTSEWRQWAWDWGANLGQWWGRRPWIETEDAR